MAGCRSTGMAASQRADYSPSPLIILDTVPTAGVASVIQPAG